jgi:hypothetical protein
VLTQPVEALLCDKMGLMFCMRKTSRSSSAEAIPPAAMFFDFYFRHHKGEQPLAHPEDFTPIVMLDLMTLSKWPHCRGCLLGARDNKTASSSRCGLTPSSKIQR